MHAKPDLRVVLEWTITGSGSVIADVMQLNLEHIIFADGVGMTCSVARSRARNRAHDS